MADALDLLRQQEEENQRQRRAQAEQAALGNLAADGPPPEAARRSAQDAARLGLDPGMAPMPGDARLGAAAAARPLIQSNPLLAQYLADPNAAALARDDVENLDIWTRLWQAWGLSRADETIRRREAAERETGDRIVRAVGTPEGRAEIGANVEQIQRNLSDPDWWRDRGSDLREWSGDVGEDFATQPEASAEIYRRSMVGWQALNGDPSALAEMDNWEPFDPPEPRTWVGTALQSSSMTLHGLIGGLRGGVEWGGYGAMGGAGIALVGGQAGPQAALPEELATVPAAAVTGALTMFPWGFSAGAAETTGQMEAGLAYQEFRAMRDENGEPLDPELARYAAYAVGGANGLIEIASLRALVRAFPGGAELLSGMTRGRMRQLLLRPTFRAAMLRAIGAVGQSAVTEGVTEAAQEAVTIFAGQAAQFIDGDDFPELTPRDALERVARAGYMGFQAGAVFGSVGATTGLAYDLPRAQQGQRDAQTFEALGNAATRSRLRQSLPERFRDFVDAVTKDGDVDTVYVPATQWMRFWQEHNVDPAEAADAIEGVGRAALAAADAAGDDIAIPMSSYYSRLAGTPAGEAFKEHMRFHPESETIAETRLREANEGVVRRTVAQILKGADLNGDQQEAADVIASEVEAQLEAAGVTLTHVNRAQAAMMAKFYVVMAERHGGNPIDLWRRFHFDIVGPLQEEARQFLETDSGVDDIKLFEQAEASGYLGRDSGEARAWLEARSRGLELTPAALDHRAKREGYDMVAFTGRRKPLEHVKPQTARHRAVDAATGLWAARAYDEGQEAAIANAYAAGDGGNVVQIRVRTKNFMRVPVHGELPAAERLARIEEARKRGKHGVVFENVADYARFFDRGDRRTMGDVVVAFREEDVRSVYDPFVPGQKRYNQMAGARAGTFPADMVPVAEAMEADGRSRDEIWRNTGLARGDDGKWRYELSTLGAHLRTTFASAKTLGEALDFPALYEAYPQLAKVPVKLELGSIAEGTAGYWMRHDKLEYDPKTGRDIWHPIIKIKSPSHGSLRSALLHEVQHAIQDIEGFALGGNPEMAMAQFPRVTRNEMRRVFGELYTAYREGGPEYGWTVMQFGEQHEGQETEAFKNWIVKRAETIVGMDMYYRLAGEVEARDVQDRDDFLTDADRAQLPPNAEAMPFRTSQVVPPRDRLVITRDHGSGSFFTPETQDIGERFGGKARPPRNRTPALPAIGSAEFSSLRDASTAKRDRGERLSLVEKWAIETGETESAAAEQRYNQAVEPPFYSALERAMEEIKTKAATPTQWRQTIENAKGVKREEIEWSGVFEWLDLMEESGRKVRKADLLAFLRANGVQVSEVVKRGQSEFDAEQAEIVRLIEQRDLLGRELDKAHRALEEKEAAAFKEALAMERLAECAAANGFGAGMMAVANMMGGHAIGAAAAIPASVGFSAAISADEQLARDIAEGRAPPDSYPGYKLRGGSPAGLEGSPWDGLRMAETYPVDLDDLPPISAEQDGADYFGRPPTEAETYVVPAGHGLEPPDAPEMHERPQRDGIPFGAGGMIADDSGDDE